VIVVLGLLEWAVWGALTFAWQAINSANSRSKNTTSWRYNFCATLSVSACYLTSILLVGNILLESRSHSKDFLLAVLLYSILSACGSVIGQQWAIRFEKNHHIQH